MLLQTPALILGKIRYGESSLIVRVYTLEMGRQSWLVNGVFKAKPSFSPGIFQPLNQVEAVLYLKPNQDLQRLKEARIGFFYNSLYNDMAKMAMVLFIAEALDKLLMEEEGNTQLFAFLNKSLQYLDLESKPSPHFHIKFLLQIAQYIGYDMHHAEEVWKESLLPMNYEEVAVLQSLIEQPITAQPAIPKPIRLHLLEVVLHWYAKHDVNLLNLKSLPVLHQVFA